MSQADVLVVEDDAEINRLVGAYVQISGCHYRSALDGNSAMREYRSRMPDVVILDVMLPDLDGFEICRRVRAEHNGKRVIVIMLTAWRMKHRGRRASPAAPTNISPNLSIPIG